MKKSTANTWKKSIAKNELPYPRGKPHRTNTMTEEQRKALDIEFDTNQAIKDELQWTWVEITKSLYDTWEEKL